MSRHERQKPCQWIRVTPHMQVRLATHHCCSPPMTVGCSGSWPASSGIARHPWRSTAIATMSGEGISTWAPGPATSGPRPLQRLRPTETQSQTLEKTPATHLRPVHARCPACSLLRSPAPADIPLHTPSPPHRHRSSCRTGSRDLDVAAKTTPYGRHREVRLDPSVTSKRAERVRMGGLTRWPIAETRPQPPPESRDVGPRARLRFNPPPHKSGLFTATLLTRAAG